MYVCIYIKKKSITDLEYKYTTFVTAMNTYDMAAYLGKQLLYAASNIRSSQVTVLLLTSKVKGADANCSWIIIFRHLNCFVTYTTEK